MFHLEFAKRSLTILLKILKSLEIFEWECPKNNPTLLYVDHAAARLVKMDRRQIRLC